MKTTLVRDDREKHGFTLLEMLVVVTIVALLAALVATQVRQAMIDAQSARTLTIVHSLKTGIHNYRTDYNRFPVLQDSNQEGDMPEFLTDGSNPLIDVLLGLPSAGGNLNPQGTQYVEFTQAHGDRAGIVGAQTPRRYHDLWGRPFRVLLDTNGDHLLANPDVANVAPKISNNTPPHLVADIAIYSTGRDALPQTQDDVVSWR